jgi:redox-sensing transcriptional repressor
MKVSERVIQRLVLYRKILQNLLADGVTKIYSHSLGDFVDSTPAQVRRDIMNIGYKGTPAHGYEISLLISGISDFVDPPQIRNVCIIGLGNLGKAILDYCDKRNSKIKIIDAFDKDLSKINIEINGCMSYHINELETKIKEDGIELAILSVPITEAQAIAERLIRSGIKGILNYSPIELRLPESIYVENRDMMLALEKVAYFAQ